MESVDQVKKARVIKVLVDTTVVAEPPSYVGRYCRTPEARARELEGWIKEFQEFLRDHRSQDSIYLSVERKYQDQCSNCHEEYEEMTDDDGNGTGRCAYCEAEIEP